MDTTPTGSAIQLSCPYFYKGKLPARLNLRDCDLLGASRENGFLTALYGYHAKTQGFMAANRFAVEQGLSFTVIDFNLNFDNKVTPSKIRTEQLPDLEFASLERLTKAALVDLGKTLEAVTGRQDDTSTITTSPTYYLRRHSSQINLLINDPAWQHMKCIVYAADLPFTSDGLSVAAIPEKFFGAISDINCRLDSSVTLFID